MNLVEEFLIEIFKDNPLGETKSCLWYITDIGIVALQKNNMENIKSYKLEEEATELDLDLCKEEKEFYKIDDKKFIVFYS